jgi:hypothetical protein
MEYVIILLNDKVLVGTYQQYKEREFEGAEWLGSSPSKEEAEERAEYIRAIRWEADYENKHAEAFNQ